MQTFCFLFGKFAVRANVEAFFRPMVFCGFCDAPVRLGNARLMRAKAICMISHVPYMASYADH